MHQTINETGSSPGTTASGATEEAATPRGAEEEVEGAGVEEGATRTLLGTHATKTGTTTVTRTIRIDRDSPGTTGVLRSQTRGSLAIRTGADASLATTRGSISSSLEARTLGATSSSSITTSTVAIQVQTDRQTTVTKTFRNQTTFR